MSDFNINNIFDFEANLTQNILWQYDNADVIKSLISQKDLWYKTNLKGFWQKVLSDFLNIDSATDWGLNLWSKILQIKRTYIIEGASVTLSTELFRRVVKGKLQLLYSNGTIPEIHHFCNSVFSDYITPYNWAVLVRDNHDMTITYIFNFAPSTEETALILSKNFLPTPAGVLATIEILPTSHIFGFYGSDFQPFNQAPFWDGTVLK